MHFPFQAASSVTMSPEILEQDYQDAQKVEQVYLGQQCFFYPGMFKLYYIPYSRIQWAYRRAEENHMTMCCGKGYVDIWYLLLYAEGRQIAKLEFQRPESAKEAFACLTGHHPEMLAGYTEENKAAFAQLT